MAVALKITTNSDKFRTPALTFKRNGVYTFAPAGTSEYIQYWTNEMDYCVNGYTAEDGDYIPGYFYFYLNYFQINLVKEIEVEGVDGHSVLRQITEQDFPNFYDYDRLFFEAIAEAERTGKHLAVLKARRKGYSYKIASMLLRNFYFFKNAKGYALAAEKEFLVKDGILTKTWDGMDFVDQNTAWFKKKQAINSIMHKRASLLTTNESGVQIEVGYKSEIIGITLKNDFQKARGKKGKLIIFEEAGKFKSLLAAWQIARPSVEQGSHVIGTMIAFGTGGTENSDFESLRELFERPRAYNCLEFDNNWEDGAADKCGFFIPQYANLEGIYMNHDDPDDPYNGIPFMDKDGNSNIEVAKKYILLERKKVIDNSSDRRAIDRHIAEQPVIPSEALLNISTNIFPKEALQRHLSFIRTHENVRSMKQVGELFFDSNGKLHWRVDGTIKDITKYRLSPGDDRNGAIAIWEHPPIDIPYGLYVIGVDPYDFDKSSTNSLGSCIVYKRFQGFEEYFEMPVAEYTGRPERADMFYEQVRMLAMYYNAQILYENEKKGLFDYMFRMKCEYLLADQPGIIKDIIKDSTVQRGKGIHMAEPIKMWGEGAIRDWLVEEYAPGKKNLTKIFSEPLLEELISYNDTGNFDRVMAFMLVMIFIKELYHVKVKEKKEFNARPLFADPLFRMGTTNDGRFRF